MAPSFGILSLTVRLFLVFQHIVIHSSLRPPPLVPAEMADMVGAGLASWLLVPPHSSLPSPLPTNESSPVPFLHAIPLFRNQQRISTA